MVEAINQIQITSWDKDRLSVKHGNQSYTYWELMIACGVRVLMDASYEDLKAEYFIPISTMTGHLRKICHPIQYINMRQLQKRMKAGHFSRSKIR